MNTRRKGFWWRNLQKKPSCSNNIPVHVFISKTCVLPCCSVLFLWHFSHEWMNELWIVALFPYFIYLYIYSQVYYSLTSKYYSPSRLKTLHLFLRTINLFTMQLPVKQSHESTWYPVPVLGYLVPGNFKDFGFISELWAKNFAFKPETEDCSNTK